MQLNINNLNELWTVAGRSLGGYTEGENVHQSSIPGSEWPCKIWTTSEISNDTITRLRDQMAKNSRLTFSYFIPKGNDVDQRLEQEFMLKSIQYGMSLELNDEFKVSKVLRLKIVETPEEARLWSSAFECAFNYAISQAVIEATHKNIPYFLIYDDTKLVGTIILYPTGDVAGIHSLGIIPEMRQKGYATEIMYQVLNHAFSNNAKIATLQASEMAKKMYMGMGFSIDFLMHNYILKP